MQLNCIITDDEPIAVDILQDYVRMVPYLNLVATCKNAMETFAALRTKEIDLLFIDIQMPEITGVDLVRALKNRPAIVFTTAYPSYALEGFELDAIDYLLKPIPIDRFLRAVDKVVSRYENAHKAITRAAANEKQYFFIKHNQELVKVYFDSILYIESMENYVKIHCEENTIVFFSTMKNIEDILAPYNFLRIHRSFIVNLDKVSSVGDNVFSIRDKRLMVGKSYKKLISDVMKNMYGLQRTSGI